MENDLLVVEIEGRKFGIPADLVREVVRAVRPMPLPRKPEATLGIINLRGNVIPVVDTRQVLDLKPREVCHSDHFVIVVENDLQCAFHVDRALDLSPRLSTGDKEESESGKSFLANTLQGFVQLLRPSDLLSRTQRQSLVRTALASVRDSAGEDERTAR